MARPCQLWNRHSAGLGMVAGMGLGGGARVSSSCSQQPEIHLRATAVTRRCSIYSEQALR